MTVPPAPVSVWDQVAAKLEGSHDPNDWQKVARPEQLPPDGDWHIWLIVAGRGAGKLLHVETPIPTPVGWTTMGQLQPGDLVLDEAGRPTCVTWASDVQYEDTWRVGFSDGSSLLAHGEHEWTTWTHAERKAFLRSQHEPDRERFPEDWPTWRARQMPTMYLRETVVEAALALSAQGVSARRIATELGVSRQALGPHLAAGRYLPRRAVVRDNALGPRTRTTDQVRASLTVGKRGDRNHSIPTCHPLDLPDVDLPIDPYVLGAWLGDGDSCGGAITGAHADLEIIRAQFESVGETTTRLKEYPGKTPRFRAEGLTRRLRLAGVLDDKHVPVRYLRASAAQRLSLLQGLMDTDGGVERASHASFTTTREPLADAVHELVVSLGMVARRNKRPARLRGVEHGVAYRVAFTPTMPVFRLPRKGDRCRSGGPQMLRHHHRMITRIERVPTVPMRCITVDSPHSLYLAGRDMVPTHNTRTGSETLTDWATTTAGTYAVVGPTFGDARAICVEGAGSGLIEVLRSHRIGHTYNRSLYEIKLSNGSLIVIVGADTPDRLRGYNLSGAWADEIASWRRPATWHEALMPALRIGAHPRLIATGTPKPVPLVKGLMARTDDSIVVTRGRTLDNAANLSKAALDELLARYQGTRLGRQELDGELLEDIEGALWTLLSIEDSRVAAAPVLTHKVVSVDPAGDGGEGHDEHGITVSGVTGRAAAAEFYVLADLSRNCSPSQAARAAILAYVEHEADAIVYEKNQGQGWITAVLQATWAEMQAAGEVRGVMPPLRAVDAARSKRLRAEPVQALYEQNRVHHVGVFPKLEDQQVSWVPGDSDSPDRLDALVHGITYLYGQARYTSASRRAPQRVPLPAGVGAALGGGRARSGFGRP